MSYYTVYIVLNVDKGVLLSNSTNMICVDM
jgi:hypothetical protein